MLKILNFDEVDSTNNLAFSLAKEHQAGNYDIINANKQTNGKGRNGKKWSSIEGNLLFSLILQFAEKPSRITDYSFIIACVIGNILNKYKISVEYKWPNDIIFSDKKLAGILSEYKIINKIPTLVLGVGLNLTSSPPYAINLRDYNIKKQDFLEKFLEDFLLLEEEYKKYGFMIIKNKYLAKAHKINQRIKLSNGQEGIFLSITDDGEIMLKDLNNNIKKLAYL